MPIPLFDIDHTLLEGGNIAHDDAFTYALRTVYQLPDARKSEIETHGMIDTQILLEIARLHGVDEEAGKAKMDAALRAMEEYYTAHADEGVCIPLPGVRALLARLRERGVPLGLLTGNVESIGWGKITRAGLREYFAFGAFGSLAYRRVDLIPIARERASQALGREVALSELFIVGDSPLDVACAKGGRVPILAVATGASPAQELAAVGADAVVETLEDQDAFFDFLAARGGRPDQPSPL